MKTLNSPDCNNCDTKCHYTYTVKDPFTGKKQARRGMKRHEDIFCKLHHPPRGTFKLAELALAHPQSLNDSLKALPFEVNLDFYLPRR